MESSSKSIPNLTLVKWHSIDKLKQSNQNLKLICLRLDRAISHPPASFGKIVHYSITATHLRIESVFIPGESLHTKIKKQNAINTRWVNNELLSMVQTWKNQNWVHGDLNLRNLILTDSNTFIAVDHKLDLNSPHRTRLFSKHNTHVDLLDVVSIDLIHRFLKQNKIAMAQTDYKLTWL